MGKRSTRVIPQGIARALPGWKFLRAASGKFGLLLVALVALILLSPLLIQNERWAAATSLCSASVLVAGLHAAKPGRGILALGLALALLDFGIGRLAMSLGTRWLLVCEALLWLTTLLYVTATILEAIFEIPMVTVETLQAALCVYLLIGLLGTFVLTLIELTLPGSFEATGGVSISWGAGRSSATSLMQMLSLSYAALSTVGSTAISPANAFASNAVSLEAMVGQIYLVVVVARLVGIESGSAMQPTRETAA
ncbi:MAG: hypothetical protein JO114_03605 [Planctomycetaceae bacterium]|nr:hypothetical protein [Planctomycetaceae bacterium]